MGLKLAATLQHFFFPKSCSWHNLVGMTAFRTGNKWYSKRVQRQHRRTGGGEPALGSRGWVGIGYMERRRQALQARGKRQAKAGDEVKAVSSKEKTRVVGGGQSVDRTGGASWWEEA